MNITVSLPPERQSELEKQAASAGTDVAGYITRIVQQSLDEQVDTATIADLPLTQWLAEFRSWVAIQKSRNPRLDDSRESIYD